MLAHFRHGPAPRLVRLLGHARCPYSALRSMAVGAAAPLNSRAARTFTTAPMLRVEPGPGAEPSPPKRKRGRPRKVLEVEPEAGTGEEPTSPKRKRGRPRKILEAEPQAGTGIKPILAVEPTPKGKRGRKKATGTDAESQPATTKKRPASVRQDLIATTPVAEALAKAKIWSDKRDKKVRTKKDPDDLLLGDKTRVNIVSDKLCDDIIKFLGSSLDRHQGCDLLDINPGVGLWSRALHDAVQPRQHIMMEPKAEEYKPFLKDAMGDRQNVAIIPKLGIIWKDLQEVLQTHFAPHHTPTPRGQTPERNDSILVTMNISSWPDRGVYSFQSLSVMVAYQLIQYIRTSSFFQQYGLVRILLWANDDFKYRMLPRSIGERVRSSFEAELTCDYIHEVAGMDSYDFNSARRSSRDEWLSYESAANCVRSMKKLGIQTTPGRESRMLKALEANPALMKPGKLAGRKPINILRPFQDELERLEQESSELADSDRDTRLRILRVRNAAEGGEYVILLELLQMMEKLIAMGPAHPQFAQLEAEFNDRLDGVKKNLRELFSSIRDNYFSFRRNNGPSLLWDRRAYEPLAADPAEFYPNAPVCLLDIQPRAMNPLFHQIGPSSTRSGDFSDILLRTAFQYRALSLPHVMNSMWPGFSDLVDRCPSFTDPRVGGSPVSGHGALAVRAMTEENWADVIRAWMDWPFRPSYLTLVGRTPEFSSPESTDEEALGGSAMGTRNL